MDKLRGFMGKMQEGSLQDLIEFLEDIAGLDEETEEEIYVGSISTELVEKLNVLERDLEDAKIKIERESEDMHRILERKKKEFSNTFLKRNDELWNEVYATIGVVKDDKKRYRVKQKIGQVFQVIKKEAPQEENEFDFRPKNG